MLLMDHSQAYLSINTCERYRQPFRASLAFKYWSLLSNELPALYLQGFHVPIASVLIPIMTFALYTYVEVGGSKGEDELSGAATQYSVSCGSYY